jgi:hypothetical protein
MQFFLLCRKDEGCSKREFTMIVMYTINNNCATKVVCCMIYNIIFDRRMWLAKGKARNFVRVKPKDKDIDQ